jgi:hypothetical protein
MGYLENRRRCVALNLGTAKVRALELKKSEQASDCRAMSRTLNEFSRSVGFNGNNLVSYAGKILSNGIKYKSYALVSPVSADYDYAVSFADVGFRSQYRDGSNQVRHFVGYFSAGIHFDYPILTAILAELRDEGEPKDIALGNVAAALGRQAAGSEHMMENIGEAIRSQICE